MQHLNGLQCTIVKLPDDQTRWECVLDDERRVNVRPDNFTIVDVHWVGTETGGGHEECGVVKVSSGTGTPPGPATSNTDTLMFSDPCEAGAPSIVIDEVHKEMLTDEQRISTTPVGENIPDVSQANNKESPRGNREINTSESSQSERNRILFNVLE